MNGDDYAQGQTVRDAAYRKAYKEWVEGLLPDERKTLERVGLLAPDFGTALGLAAAHGSRSNDAAESKEAMVEVDMAELFDSLPEFLMETMGLSKEQAGLVSEWHHSVAETHSRIYKAWLLNKLIGGLLNHENVKLAAGALAFATNLSALNGMGTMTAWARSCALTREAVSKAAKWWQRELDLAPSVHMKTKTACESYAAPRLHWRAQIYANKRADGVRKGQGCGPDDGGPAGSRGEDSGQGHLRAMEGSPSVVASVQ